MGEPNMYKIIPNVGATCWMNAAIQMLYHVPEFRDTMTAYKKSTPLVIASLKEIFSAIGAKKNLNEIMNTHKRNLIPTSDPVGNSQKDTSEFLAYVFSPLTLSYFTIKETTTKTCLEYQSIKGTGAPTEEHNSGLILNLPITQNATDISSLLTEYQSPEELETGLSSCLTEDDKNTLTDEIARLTVVDTVESKNRQSDISKILENGLPASKITKISDSSTYLILCLKRSIKDKKVNTSITANDHITLNDKLYRLRGFIYQSGSVDSGHYVYYWNNGEKWYEFDDQKKAVREAPEINESDKNNPLNLGYVYLYELDTEFKHRNYPRGPGIITGPVKPVITGPVKPVIIGPVKPVITGHEESGQNNRLTGKPIPGEIVNYSGVFSTIKLTEKDTIFYYAGSSCNITTEITPTSENRDELDFLNMHGLVVVRNGKYFISEEAFSYLYHNFNYLNLMTEYTLPGRLANITAAKRLQKNIQASNTLDLQENEIKEYITKLTARAPPSQPPQQSSPSPQQSSPSPSPSPSSPPPSSP